MEVNVKHRRTVGNVLEEQAARERAAAQLVSRLEELGKQTSAAPDAGGLSDTARELLELRRELEKRAVMTAINLVDGGDAATILAVLKLPSAR